MDAAQERRTKLGELLDLAQNYKGWTRKELAKSLGRDPTKLIPGSGVPKLDFVVDLAKVLDWEIGDVVDHLWDRRPTAAPETVEATFDAIDHDAREAHRQGRYREMIEIAEKAFGAAQHPEERARACTRLAAGWDGLGRYNNVLSSVQRGLAQSPIAPDFRRQLQSNLAASYYSLWALIEARAISSDLIHWFLEHAPTTTRDRKTQAFAYYVSGHAYRRLVTAERDREQELAELARTHLTRGRDLYIALGDELGDPSCHGIANTCHGGLIEVDVVLGERGVAQALDELTDGLAEIGPETDLDSDQLESMAWWSIFGCNVALRGLDNERDLQQRMAVFTNKADEIANRLDNWSLRERVFTMEHSRWERAVGCTGFDIPRVVDEDEVRVITGTMARFPMFHETGWQILRSAKIVRAS
jgi:tetratricopeptide (TPR) repeat protein